MISFSLPSLLTFKFKVSVIGDFYYGYGAEKQHYPNGEHVLDPNFEITVEPRDANFNALK